MISGSRKRKHRSHRSHPQSPPSTQVKFLSHYDHSTRTHDHGEIVESDTRPDPLHALYIQAHEADVVRGSHAKAAAQSLEVVEYNSSLNSVGEVTIVSKIGSALIQWGGDSTSIGKSYGDDGGDEDDMLPPATQGTMETPIWVDRYVPLFRFPRFHSFEMSCVYDSCICMVFHISKSDHHSEIRCLSLT